MSVKDTFTLQPDSEDSLENTGHQHSSLRTCVEHAMGKYFYHLDGQDTTDLYQMVLSEIEGPLLEAVLEYCNNNQSRASAILGLNRGTLRKKLKQYDLL